MPTTPAAVVVGGGIVGLAVAERIAQTDPRERVVVLEKEHAPAQHQTGRNSGVIHSGLYYPPGSRKAVMCRAGAESMARFAREEGIPYEVCGKLVVATSDAELAALNRLAQRGRDNGLQVRELHPREAREFEPHVNAVRALHVASTGIIDYGAVCRALVGRLERAGAALRLDSEVFGARLDGGRLTLETSTGPVAARVVVNCAGLQSDLVARRLGADPGARIVPFRGEYFELRHERRHLVRHLIYPVPDPTFPFLGVHLTRGVDGGVHAGPNAVLALAREGYGWRRVVPREVWETLSYPGFWRLAARHARPGLAELARSASRRLFATSLRRLVPEIRDDDLVPAAPGVRAQALGRDGRLVDDFLIERSEGMVHVLNAPSPAATSAFEIARHVVDLLPER